MSGDGAERPRPQPSELTRPFWDACARGELRAQRCRECGRWRHYPQPMCPACHATAHTWERLSGRGTIHSYSVAHRAFHPAWADRVPYVVATIELEEGLRMVSDMPELPPEDVAIGLPVEVFFEALDDALTLPRFRVVES